jgi:hypothetical protein
MALNGHRLSGCQRSQPDDRLDITSFPGVVDQTGRVTHVAKFGQDELVQATPIRRTQR